MKRKRGKELKSTRIIDERDIADNLELYSIAIHLHHSRIALAHARQKRATPTCIMLLGIDIGTTNVKVVLVEETTRQVVHKHSLPLGEPPKVDAPRGAAERSVAQIFQTLEKCMTCLESAAQLLGKVRAIGVCGQMHGCVLWNSSGHSMLNEYTRTLQHEETLSSNFITWEDTRCDSEFLYSLPKPPSSPEHSVRAGYGCATLAWLQCHNRETLSCYDRAGTIMDMVVCALCSGGSGDVIMSSQNAEGWGYFDRSSLQWHKEM